MPRLVRFMFASCALALSISALPPARAWERGPDLPGPRKGAAVVADGNRVLVFGGRTTGNVLIASSHALDTGAGEWSALSPMPEPRDGSGCVRIGDDVYVFGGFTPGQTATALRYRISTDTWTTIASMPAPNSNMACATIGGKIYLFGGGHDGPPLDVAWCYDPATDSWSALAPLPRPRKSCAAVVLGGTVHVIGGHTASSGVNDATPWVDVYDPSTGNWALAPDLTVPLTGGAATVRNGRIWLMGGIDGTVAYRKFAAVWSFGPGETGWSAENPMPTELGGAAAVITDATTIYVLGGSDNFVEGVATVYRQFLDNPDIEVLRDVPNDQGGWVSIRWLASLLDRSPVGPVDAYWIWREVPVEAAFREMESGARLLAAGDRPSEAAGRQIRTTREGARFIYWEYVGAQVAHGFPAYSFTAPTAFDSLPGSNPETRFMVEAEDLSTGDYWQSVPKSGYSVDNLAPPAPGPIAYRINGSGMTLSWLPSAAPDLAGYRVHFGATPDFETSEGTLVGSATDTAYAAVLQGSGFYKVRGVDVHGNEGPASSALANVLSVENGQSPGLALAPPVPNPATGATRVRYTLARDGDVTLALHDVSGRRCRVLASGPRRAGQHDLVFTLEDEGGERLRAGLYFLKLDVEGRSVTNRLAIVR